MARHVGFSNSRPFAGCATHRLGISPFNHDKLVDKVKHSAG